MKTFFWCCSVVIQVMLVCYGLSAVITAIIVASGYALGYDGYETLYTGWKPYPSVSPLELALYWLISGIVALTLWAAITKWVESPKRS